MTGNAQSHMVDLPGGRFHYLTWNAEQAALPPFVLLHGITSSAGSWVRVAPALADRYRVYALDLRGHGDSVKPPAGSYSLRQTADDVVAFMEALDLQRPVLLGHSWGGATALVLASGEAAEKPAPALAKVILEDPACNFGRGDATERAAPFIKDVGRDPAQLRPALLTESPDWSVEDIDAKVEALGKVSREAVISVFDQAGEMGSLLPLLAKLTMPALLMRADVHRGTTLPPSAWDEAHGYLPANACAVEIAGASHNIHRDSFDAFMRAINSFLH